jgi:hypothetical protein
MSRQSTIRANAINKDFSEIEKKAATVVSELVKQVDLVKLLTVFLHDNLLADKGDLSEGDRMVTRDALIPLYPQLQKAISDIELLFNIHDANAMTWQANLDAYLANNPTLLAEALNRYPEIS